MKIFMKICMKYLHANCLQWRQFACRHFMQILSPLETICMKFESLLSGKNKQKYIKISVENFTESTKY